MTRYVRFQGTSSRRDDPHTGVFRLVNQLGWDGRLSADDEAHRVAVNEWFEDAFPDPSTVDPAAYGEHPGAVAWFKLDGSAHLVQRLARHFEILDRHGVAWERVETGDPGEIVYEDEFQAVAVPH